MQGWCLCGAGEYAEFERRYGVAVEVSFGVGVERRIICGRISLSQSRQCCEIGERTFVDICDAIGLHGPWMVLSSMSDSVVWADRDVSLVRLANVLGSTTVMEL